MIWSFSGHNQFRRCQRQWYYKNLMASALSKKDALRREAYVLSTLQSIYAWRGTIADDIITNKVIPAIANGYDFTKDKIMKNAKELCRLRYDFAMDRKYREEGMSKSAAGDSFSAFHAIEYDLPLGNEDFKNAWNEIETSLTNFLGNKDLLEYLKSADRLITQRALTFKVNGYTVRGVPDLIVFFKDEPPHIFDWKVHVFATKMYHEQLLIYALGLTKGKPHVDFPESLNINSISDIRVSEYQLLKNTLRDYSVTDEYRHDIEELISESIINMSIVGANRKYAEVDIEDFATASYPETCNSCSFKKLCWDEK